MRVLSFALISLPFTAAFSPSFFPQKNAVTVNPLCPPAIKAGVASINADIQDQMNEQSALAKVKQLEQAHPPNEARIQEAISELLDDVNKGLRQVITSSRTLPKNNPAQSGLASKLTQGKMTEKMLVESLKGNFKEDSSTISTLATDFSNGIKKNMQNGIDVSAKTMS
ncbi:hypothetical protein NA57DRAFT_78510 [Rhizodiscina lignyota]|uniref:Secreted protein n=1 Tax=Rhizodiscina lignyota TaxID=1504668 RepID=A0A9P4I8E3_9PEZI|nr:hypothetical protein NA57DRAFT_78510 [Rhizodiscina lignyota]